MKKTVDRGLGISRTMIGRNAEGLTLIEVMIVVIVIGLVAAAAIPTISQSLENMAARDVAVELMRVVHTTRSEAILDGHSFAVTLSEMDSQPGSGIITIFRNPNDADPDSLTFLEGDVESYYKYPVIVQQPTVAITQAVLNGGVIVNDLTLYVRSNGSVVDEDGNPLTGAGVLVNVARIGADGAAVGVVRQVRIPFNGLATLVR